MVPTGVAKQNAAEKLQWCTFLSIYEDQTQIAPIRPPACSLPIHIHTKDINELEFEREPTKAHNESGKNGYRREDCRLPRTVGPRSSSFFTATGSRRKSYQPFKTFNATSRFIGAEQSEENQSNTPYKISNKSLFNNSTDGTNISLVDPELTTHGIDPRVPQIPPTTWPTDATISAGKTIRKALNARSCMLSCSATKTQTSSGGGHHKQVAPEKESQHRRPRLVGVGSKRRIVVGVRCRGPPSIS